MGTFLEKTMKLKHRPTSTRTEVKVVVTLGVVAATALMAIGYEFLGIPLAVGSNVVWIWES